jgi:hypothetical protein
VRWLQDDWVSFSVTSRRDQKLIGILGTAQRSVKLRAGNPTRRYASWHERQRQSDGIPDGRYIGQTCKDWHLAAEELGLVYV